MGSIYKRKWKAPDGTLRESTVWWIKYYRNGKPIRESSESTKISVARDLLKDREGDIVKGVPVSSKMSRVRFDELAGDMVTDYKVNEKRSLRDLEMRLNNHVLPFFGSRRAVSITTADVNRFVLRRQESGASNGEINRELTAVKRAFSLGVQAGKILAKPHIPMLRENNVRTGFFEREQFDALLLALPDYLQPVAQFAYITGWRIPSEVLKLQWSQMTFSQARSGSKQERPRTMTDAYFRSPLNCALSWRSSIWKRGTWSVRKESSSLGCFIAKAGGFSRSANRGRALAWKQVCP